MNEDRERHPRPSNPSCGGEETSAGPLSDEQVSAMLLGPLPRIDAPSVVVALGPEAAHGAVRLRELDRALRAPAPRAGTEKYEILRTIGQGGMGRVYLAYDHDLKRTVALKMVKARDPRREARFLKEAQVVAQLEHPNIVPLHEFGLGEGNSPYYTMPVVRGESLQEILSGLQVEDPRLVKAYSLTRLVQVVQQIALALAYAHDKGVVHRDLKPANVMLGEHGEVRVLDWGLSLILGEEGGDDRAAASPGASAHIVGTPMFMAPEQSLGGAVTPACDLYSLGVILYIVLTLTPPFQGRTADILESHRKDEPQPPRLRAPQREIPRELERVCLRALHKQPGDRHPGARALHDELQAWLETEADSRERHQRAEDRARDGAGKLKAWLDLHAEVRRLGAAAAAMAGQFRPWQSSEEKAPLFAAERQAEQAQHELAIKASEVIATLTEALGFERDNAAASGLLADYYFRCFLDAEESGAGRDRDLYGRLVSKYDDTRYAHVLVGDGRLGLDSDPPGAEVWLHDLVEHHARLVEANPRRIGRTPLADVPVAMGSYLAVLRLAGYRDLRYPVLIGRNQHWEGRVRMVPEPDIGPDFVHVPAGPFVFGGDAQARGLSGPRQILELDDLFIAVHPVTMGEYLEFLNAIASSDPALARRRAPRHGPDGESYLLQDGDGTLRMPEVDKDGDRWDPRWPVFLVSWHDAVAYTEWRSRRDGVEYRLPTEFEWEKAARGVDGRAFPWGNRWDASLTNVRESRRERPAPVPVDDFPGDVSIYGVRGMAGNSQDWTATAIEVGAGESARDARITRGGGWDTDPSEARAATRTWNGHANVTHFTGFRLVRVQRPG